MIQDTKHDTIIAGVKIAPAVGGTVWTAFTLNEWVAIATLCYIVLQIGLLIPKYVKAVTDWRKKREKK